VIVILGNGQAGNHVANELEKRGEPHVTISHSHWDSNSELVELLKGSNAKAVINCAAQRDIKLCEDNPDTAIEVNVNLPLAVSTAGFRQVYLSTDYVYDRNEENRTLHEDEPSRGALSVYGDSKLQGEKAVLELGGIVARISSPFGPRKSPFKPSFVDFVTTNFTNLELPCDQHFRMTYMPDGAKAIVDLALGAESGIYHVVNEGTTDWAELATFARKEFRNKNKTLAVTRKDLTRPVWGNIKNTKLPPLRHWADAMVEYAGRKS
jgi:dTDP-4-dehydrorhamnose reductase